MANMSKNKWRAERFRSAAVRRSVHQRAAKSAQEKRKKLCVTTDSTVKGTIEPSEIEEKLSEDEIDSFTIDIFLMFSLFVGLTALFRGILFLIHSAFHLPFIGQ